MRFEVYSGRALTKLKSLKRMFQPYSERLDQHSRLVKRLIINFKSGDEELICNILGDIAKTNLSLTYCEVDLLFSYLAQTLPGKPSFLVIALLVNLKARVSRASCDLAIKGYRQAKSSGAIDENYNKAMSLLIQNREKVTFQK